ncbi:hypothetical protein [Niabella aurantiaca]|uniref:hypothetical protein n=1 Tax=Niabella aurantiaca TaxID=379900 RepID=UPI0003697FC9|nr:hypothetical protein [Niabella aurantiaca]
MAEIEEGSAHYKITADTSDLHGKGVKDAVDAFQKISSEAEKAGSKMDQAFKAKHVEQYKNVIDRLTGTIAENEKFLATLINEQNAHSASLKNGEKVTAEYLAKEAQLASEVSFVTKVLQQQRIEQTAGAGSVAALDARVKLLTLSYNQLSQAEQKALVGQTLQKELGTAKVALEQAKKPLDDVGKTATTMGSKVSSGASAAWGALRKLAYIIPGLGIAGLIGILIDPIVNLFSRILKGSEAVQRLKKELDDLKSAQKDANKTAGEQIGQLHSLNAVLQSTTASAKAKKGAYDELVKLYPSYADQLRDEYEKTGNVANVINTQLIPAIVAASKARALQSRMDALTTQNLDLDDEMLRIAKEQNKAEQDLAEIRKKNKREGNDVGFAAVNRGPDQEDIASTKVKAIKDSWKEVYTQQQANTKQLDAYAGQITSIQAKMGNLTTSGTDAGRGSGKGRTPKNTDQAEFAAKKALEDLRQKIADSKGKFDIQFGSNIESEQDKINGYFNGLKRDVIAFNSNPKNKLHLIDSKTAFADIENNRKHALGLADFDQGSQNLFKQLQQDKAAYKDYEDFKLKYGKDSADRLYSDLLTKGESYYQELKLLEYSMTKADESGRLDSAGKARLVQVKQLATEAAFESEQMAKRRVEIETKMYLDLLQKAGNYQVQVDLLEKERTARMAALERDRTHIGEEEYKRRFAIINKAYEKGTKELSIFESDLFKKLNSDVETGSKEQIQGIIKDLDEALRTGKLKDATGKMVDVPPDVLIRLASAKEQLKGIIEQIIGIQITSSKIGRVAVDLDKVGQALTGIGGALSSAGDGSMGETVSRMGELLINISTAYTSISKVVKTAKDAIKSGKDVVTNLLESNDLWGAILAIINIVVSLFGAGKRYKDSLIEAQRALADQNSDLILGEYKISEQLREQNMLRAEGIKLTKEQLAARRKVAEENDKQIQDETKRLLEEIQGGEQVYYRYIDKPGGLNKLFGGKATTKTRYGGLGSYKTEDFIAYMKAAGYGDLNILNDIVNKYGQGGTISRAALDDLDIKGLFGQKNSQGMKSFHEAISQLDASGKRIKVTWDELKDLNAKGLLEGSTKALYDQLAALEQQGVDVRNVLADIAAEEKEIATATTASAISDSIVQGFRDGKRSAADFAGDFELLMREALLNSLRYDPAMEKAAQDWYDQFAAAAADGVIDATEKNVLNQGYKDMIERNNARAKMLEESTGISLSDPKGGKSVNNLSGAYAQASQQSIDLLTAQSMGMRVAQLTTNDLLKTGFVSLNDIANRSLDNLQKIERNTYNTVERLDNAVKYLKSMDGKMTDTTNNNRLTGI